MTTSTGSPLSSVGLYCHCDTACLRRLHQQRMAADQLQILNSAVLADDRGEPHHALNARLLGQRRIHRGDLADQVGLLHVAADADALTAWRLWLPL